MLRPNSMWPLFMLTAAKGTTDFADTELIDPY